MSESEGPKKNKGGRPKGTTKAAMAARRALQLQPAPPTPALERKAAALGVPLLECDHEFAQRLVEDPRARLTWLSMVISEGKVPLRDRLAALKLMMDMDPRTPAQMGLGTGSEPERTILNSVAKEELVDPDPEPVGNDNVVIALPIGSKVG